MVYISRHGNLISSEIRGTLSEVMKVGGREPICCGEQMIKMEK